MTSYLNDVFNGEGHINLITLRFRNAEFQALFDEECRRGAEILQKLLMNILLLACIFIVYANIYNLGSLYHLWQFHLEQDQWQILSAENCDKSHRLREYQLQDVRKSDLARNLQCYAFRCLYLGCLCFI
jgi:hypothetical protein